MIRRVSLLSCTDDRIVLLPIGGGMGVVVGLGVVVVVVVVVVIVVEVVVDLLLSIIFLNSSLLKSSMNASG